MSRKLLLTWRTAIAAISVYVAYSATIHTIVFLTQYRNPTTALRFEPHNPVALVRDAQLRLATGRSSSLNRQDLLDIARDSIRKLPINAAAFRLFTVMNTFGSDLGEVREQIAMSDRLSRRDLATQLFLIEDSVGRNDIAAALHHYDTALRVKQSSRALLYPVLTDAMEVPAIRKRFLPYMADPPPWLESFLRFAVSNTDDPSAIAAMAINAKGFPTASAYQSLNAELLARLVAGADLKGAVHYFRSIKGADKDLLTTLEMTDSTSASQFAPISWQPIAIDGIDPVFVAVGGKVLELETTMDSGYQGQVARKLIALPAGRYSLLVPIRSEDFAKSDVLTWMISCNGSTEGVTPFSATTNLASEFQIAGSFAIPEGCPVQMVTVTARTSMRHTAVTLNISSPKLERLR